MEYPDIETALFKARRDNLDQIVQRRGGRGKQSEVSKLIGWTLSATGQFLNKDRHIGYESARKIEETFGLPRFALDQHPLAEADLAAWEAKRLLDSLTDEQRAELKKLL